MDKKQLSTIISVGIIFIIAIALFFLRKTDYSHITFECDKIICGILQDHGIDTEFLLKKTHKRASSFKKEAQSLEKEFLIPISQSLTKIKTALVSSSQFESIRIGKIQKKQTKKENILILNFYYDKLQIYRLVLRQKIILAKIALVIDDWGYNNKVLRKALDLKIPITFAILPRLPYSTKIANRVNSSGHEAILHLPLEPHNAEKHPLEKNTIFTSMAQEEIEIILKEDITSVPDITGINNHMGSKATESEHVLNILFDYIKNNGLYFLDSYTSNNSLAPRIAKQKGILFAKRDVFIDNVNDKNHIKEQLLKAKSIAATKGNVIAIGHAKALTLDTIKEIIPQFEKEGFKFVYLTEILNTIAVTPKQNLPTSAEPSVKQ